MSHIPNSSRFEKKQEKRRRSILLNAVLGIVILIAIIVTYQLVVSSSKQATNERKEATKKNEGTGELVVKEDNKEKADEQAEPEPVEDTKVQVLNQTDPAVQEAYTNPSWQAVGTLQSEPHTTQFDDSTQDWKEMIQAISYALNVPSDTLVILFIGNNGANKAVGTVLAQDTKQKYRVYIEWVDNQGWKPTLVQVMK